MHEVANSNEYVILKHILYSVRPEFPAQVAIEVHSVILDYLVNGEL